MFIKAKRFCFFGAASILAALFIGTILSLIQPLPTIEQEPFTIIQEYSWEPGPWQPIAKPTPQYAEVKITEIQQARYMSARQLKLVDVTNVTKPSHISVAKLQKFVDQYCPAFTDLTEDLEAMDSRINAVFILAVSRCETGGGDPELLMGDYNIFNIRNSDGSYCNYNSYKESLEHFVRLLTIEYLHPNGRYYTGTSIKAIGQHYAVPEWAPFVTSICEEIASNISC